MKVIDCEQNTPEWHEARRGIPTASSFSRFCTPAKMQYASGAKAYMLELLAEELTTEPPAFQGSYHTERGHELEPQAREAYALITDTQPETLGFVTNDAGSAGCSPDAWQLEIKCPMAKTHISYQLGGCVPNEYLTQVHGSMLICEVDWWDFISYHPELPPFIVREERSDITDKLAQHLDRFLDEYNTLKHKYALLSA